MNSGKDAGKEIVDLATVDVVDESKMVKLRACNSVIRTEDRKAIPVLLLAANSTPGVQRAAFAAVIANSPSEAPVITASYGSSRVSIRKDGTPCVDQKGRLSYLPLGVDESVSTALKGSAPLNKRIGTVDIPCGVCLILANGGVGKTPLAHALASAGVSEYTTVRVGEPFAGYASSGPDVAFSLANAMLNHADVVLDSIKDLLSGGGAAMKSGLSRDALVNLSSWASLACEVGCTVYIPVNPSTQDPEVMSMLAEISKSNATMTVVSVGGSKWSYAARTGEGLRRKEGLLNLAFKDNVSTVSGEDAGSKMGDTDHSRYVASVLNVSVWDRATRRGLNQAN